MANSRTSAVARKWRVTARALRRKSGFTLKKGEVLGGEGSQAKRTSVEEEGGSLSGSVNVTSPGGPGTLLFYFMSSQSCNRQRSWKTKGPLMRWLGKMSQGLL